MSVNDALDGLGMPRPVEEQGGESGTCGFCGFGEGFLGEMGDETTQYLHGAVRRGEAPDWTYEMHPNAWGHGTVTWCGSCVSGLAHKFQRDDDTNLRARLVSGKVRLELDGLRWSHWGEPKPPDDVHPRDDSAVHMEKLRLDRDLRDMEHEQMRRAGFDLTTRGWRP